jgi:hypothetical protein
MLSLPHPSASSLQNSMSQLFEWMTLKGPWLIRPSATVSAEAAANMSVDGLLPMTISYLLLKALEVDANAASNSAPAAASVQGKKSDLLRLYAMRAGLSKFDWADSGSSEGVLQLLLRACTHPSFLRAAEGRRLLAYIFVELVPLNPAEFARDPDAMASALTTSQRLIATIHNAIKVQLPNTRGSLVAAHAEVYMRAWKTLHTAARAADSMGMNISFDEGSKSAAQMLLESFESDVVMDLFHGAVHCASPVTRKALATLLENSFHDPALRAGAAAGGTKSKFGAALDSLLCRGWEPILWRALTAKNALVRRNAAQVFVTLFPIVNPQLNNNNEQERRARARSQATMSCSSSSSLVSRISSLTLILACESWQSREHAVSCRSTGSSSRLRFPKRCYKRSSQIQCWMHPQAGFWCG